MASLALGLSKNRGPPQQTIVDVIIFPIQTAVKLGYRLFWLDIYLLIALWFMLIVSIMDIMDDNPQETR